jgi:hypothetical protein
VNNLAYDYHRDSYAMDELLDGKIVAMTLSPHKHHNSVKRNLLALFKAYLRGSRNVLLVDPFLSFCQRRIGFDLI